MSRWSICLLPLAAALSSCTTSARRAEILWDRWGVPHIYAQDEKALFYALAWAQMENHGSLLLELYGQARGRGAEYFGESRLEEDRWIRTNQVLERAVEWLSQQDPAFAANLDEFARAINDYAESHPSRLTPQLRRVLPVHATDILAHVQRAVHLGIVFPAGMRAELRDWERGQSKLLALNTLENASHDGSNTWVVDGRHTSSRKPMLLINPHLAWTGMTTYFEAHAVIPGQLDFYGAAQVGSPVLRLGFNEALGWSHTNNPLDAVDLYRLTVDGDTYRFDGGARPFETDEQSIRVLQPDGTHRTETLTIRRSLHGPVVAVRGSEALALRMAGLDQPQMLHQYWRMAHAREWPEFEAQLRRLQIPAYNITYADRRGRIAHYYNGTIPRRPEGNWDWSGIVPGDTSATLWTQTHSFDELPHTIKPATGWLQNANDPPWWNTLPPELNPDRYPAYMAPRTMHFRALASLRLLKENKGGLTLDDFVRLKHSTHVESANHLLDELLALDKLNPEAARILRTWDRHMNPDSRGAVLWEAFLREWWKRLDRTGSLGGIRPGVPDIYKQPWDPAGNPLNTPTGFADPALAVEALNAAASTLGPHMDQLWRGALTLPGGLPANGGPADLGLFRTLNAVGRDYSNATKPALGGPEFPRTVTHGDSFVAVVEFTVPQRARVLLSYGNATEPGSRHKGDQWKLLSENQLRPVWRHRLDIEANLHRREEIH
ncbi:MAG: acylase [Acidobacteria bacterium]|nr:acylase [Acidobacteriota bacterium]